MPAARIMPEIAGGDKSSGIKGSFVVSSGVIAITEISQRQSNAEDRMSQTYAKIYRLLSEGKEAVLYSALSRSKREKKVISGDELSAWRDKTGSAESLWMIREGESIELSEIFLPKPRLVLFGGGHITAALAPLASQIGFNLLIYDDRPFFCNPERFPTAQETICEAFDRLPEMIKLRESDYCAILTRGHKHDQNCLRFVLSGPLPFYYGMIGSKRRVAIVKKKMAEDGFGEDSIAGLRSPIGLPIGALSPTEIAISILAEVIQVRRLSQHGPLKSDQAGENQADMELLGFLSREGREAAAVLTVISAIGSTPRSSGAKMAALFDGRTIGSIGGGCAESEALLEARALIGTGGYGIKTVDLTDSAEEDGMVCGGKMEILMEDAGN
jgi:xanthine dehydrogenase accessory factor